MQWQEQVLALVEGIGRDQHPLPGLAEKLMDHDASITGVVPGEVGSRPDQVSPNLLGSPAFSIRDQGLHQDA